MMTKEQIIRLEYTASHIREKTSAIYQGVLVQSPVMESGNFTRIVPGDLELMFDLYDRLFFDGFFKRTCPGKIFFRLSSTMTDAAGKTVSHLRSRTYIITLSTALLFETFRDIKREITVNGIVCRDRLQAAQRVIEHEICHLLERELFNAGSNCLGPRYRRLVKKLFGHTDVTHRLITPRERAGTQYRIHEGDEVLFRRGGGVLRGTVFRIGTEVMVLVPDSNGIFRDRKNRRCSRYHVPLEHIMKPFV